MIGQSNNNAILKPGQAITSLPSHLAGEIFLHPAQLAAMPRIARLIASLRSCTRSADLFEFQRQLFGDIYTAEQRRAECSRILKRLRRGESLPSDVSAPPAIGAGTELENWSAEAFVFERITRQLRTVGDAMAWQCFAYDRRKILSLSRNDSPGMIVGKDGLGFELGHVEELWREKHHLGLLHDITNCLRIGDATEFTADGQELLHEVKATPRTDKAQLRRMQVAIDSIMKGGPLPGSRPNAGLVRLATSYKTGLGALQDLLHLAKEHGCRGMKLPPGRAVIAASVFRMQEIWGSNPAKGRAAWQSARQRALVRARIHEARHQIHGNSGDKASRSPSAAPWSIYPFSPEDCAALICDLMTFEVILDPGVLVDELRKVGLSAEIKLPPANGNLPAEGNVLHIQWGNRNLLLHNQGLDQLLFELVDPPTWAKGMRELLQLDSLPGEPALVFADEAETWRQPARNPG